MTGHEEIRGQLSAYCGGDLTPAERLRVEEHLSACADCRRELADLETTMGLLRSEPQAEPPPWLASRIMARVREESEAHPCGWRQRLLVPLRLKRPLEALAVVLVCLVSYFIARDTGLLPPAPPKPASVPAVGSRPAAPPLERQPAAVPPTVAPRQTVPAPPAAPPLPAGEGYAPPPSTAAPAPLPSPPRREEALPASHAQDAVPREPAPTRESLPRLKQAAPEVKKARSLDGGGVSSEADSRLGAPAAPAPSLQLRLVVVDPEGADAAIRRAVAAVGGIVSDQAAPRQLVIRMPAQRLPALFGQLAAIGRLAERPALEGLAGTVELTIRW